MTELTMKDYSSYLVEKPFACDVEGCSMKFTNEDHLTVHKKRHDMVLNLGLGSKGNMFADQTPTPTSFIRHCEEVGLFQDLQNVNPFEETFKKAAEAVKTGLTPCLDRPFQSNPPDDTLHTPNIFPHITDLTCIPQEDNCTPSEILHNFTSKKEISESTDTLAVYKESGKEIVKNQKEDESCLKKIISLEEKSAVVELPNRNFIQLVDRDAPCQMLILNNNQDSNVAVKDKLRKSLNEKTIVEAVMPLKVPIPKIVNNNLKVTNKFSTFKKNAMKLMDRQKTGIFELSSKKRKKKEDFLDREARRNRGEEFLARNRAAATRCREKKKMYICNLENLNRELTVTNQNLQLLSVKLQDQITELRTELLKHKTCNMADTCTKAMISKIIQSNDIIPTKKKQENKTVKKQPSPPKKIEVSTVNDIPTEKIKNLEINDTVMFDFVEVTLNENEEEECHIPLNDTSNIINPQIVSTNVNEVPANCLLLKNVEKLGESSKQVYNEHSYFAKQVAIDVSKRFLNYKSLRTNVLPPDLQWKNLGDGDDREGNRITTNSVILDTRTPPPLILLKPFKKRNLRSNAAEKS